MPFEWVRSLWWGPGPLFLFVPPAFASTLDFGSARPDAVQRGIAKSELAALFPYRAPFADE